MKNREAVIIKFRGDSRNVIKPGDEVEKAFKELGESAYKLLDYYYSKVTGWKFIDEHIGYALNMKAKKTVQTARNELITKGYLLIYKGEMDIYIIGLKKVAEHKQNLEQEKLDDN